MGLRDRLSHSFRGQSKQSPGGKYKVIVKLAERVEGAYTKNHIHFDFLPHDQLAKFVTPKDVADVLKDSEVHHPKSLAKFVLDNARKLFLILVMMSEENNEKVSLLLDLKQSGITDASLPIKFENEQKGGPFKWFSLEASEKINHDFFGNWTRRDRDLFADISQWRFLAPVFGGSTFRFHFHPDRKLPYLHAELKPASDGFFGEVSRVEIHRAHVPSQLAVSCP